MLSCWFVCLRIALLFCGWLVGTLAGALCLVLGFVWFTLIWLIVAFVFGWAVLVVFGDLCWLLRDLRLLTGLFVIVWWFWCMCSGLGLVWNVGFRFAGFAVFGGLMVGCVGSRSVWFG